MVSEQKKMQISDPIYVEFQQYNGHYSHILQNSHKLMCKITEFRIIMSKIILVSILLRETLNIAKMVKLVADMEIWPA